MKENIIDYELALNTKQTKAILKHWNMLSEIPGFILYAPLQKNKELTFSTTYSAFIQFSKNIMYEIFMLETKEVVINENGSQGSK